jgi:hypothetical protein
LRWELSEKSGAKGHVGGGIGKFFASTMATEIGVRPGAKRAESTINNRIKSPESVMVRAFETLVPDLLDHDLPLTGIVRTSIV